LIKTVFMKARKGGTMEIKTGGSTLPVNYTAMYETQSTRTNASAGATEGQKAGPRPGGTPPAGSGPKPAEMDSATLSSSTGTTGAGSTSSASQIYDPRDINQDGVVSPQEMVKAATQQSSDATTVNQAATQNMATSQVQAGLAAYQQSQQANATNKSLLFSV
jgi:hypothetical protein